MMMTGSVFYECYFNHIGILQIGFVWGMLDIHNFYMVISNRQNSTSGACKYLILNAIFNKSNCEPFIGVYWQIKRIQVSDDEIEKKDKFDNMIKAIKSRKAFPKYSVVLWEVFIILYTPIKIGQ